MELYPLFQNKFAEGNFRFDFITQQKCFHHIVAHNDASQEQERTGIVMLILRTRDGGTILRKQQNYP